MKHRRQVRDDLMCCRQIHLSGHKKSYKTMQDLLPSLSPLNLLVLSRRWSYERVTVWLRHSNIQETSHFFNIITPFYVK